jgi:hypothetical protein
VAKQEWVGDKKYFYRLPGSATPDIFKKTSAKCMKRKPGVPWLLILLLSFIAILFISWLVYNYYMNKLLQGK